VSYILAPAQPIGNGCHEPADALNRAVLPAGRCKKAMPKGRSLQGRISPAKRAQIVEMLTKGDGIRATARAVGTGNETLHPIARKRVG
jgi:hypothetical protein